MVFKFIHIIIFFKYLVSLLNRKNLAGDIFGVNFLSFEENHSHDRLGRSGEHSYDFQNFNETFCAKIFAFSFKIDHFEHSEITSTFKIFSNKIWAGDGAHAAMFVVVFSERQDLIIFYLTPSLQAVTFF